MTSIVMLVKDRPRLTEQTLRTLYDTTPKDQFSLTIINDGSEQGLTNQLASFVARHSYNCRQAIVSPGMEWSGCVGALKNLGAEQSDELFGRGDCLCFIDNDIAFMPNWLDVMTGNLSNGECHGLKIIGGYRHPYHQPIEHDSAYAVRQEALVDLTDAVAGYMHFMTWQTWDKYGPYDANAKGVCQSEDYALCRKVVDDGGLVGYVHPLVIANCGLTNSEGKPAVGSELFPRIAGLIYE